MPASTLRTRCPSGPTVRRYIASTDSIKSGCFQDLIGVLALDGMGRLWRIREVSARSRDSNWRRVWKACSTSFSWPPSTRPTLAATPTPQKADRKQPHRRNRTRACSRGHQGIISILVILPPFSSTVSTLWSKQCLKKNRLSNFLSLAQSRRFCDNKITIASKWEDR